MLTLTCLSFPFDGVKLITGMSICLSSYVSGSPDALASTITDSGFQYLYCSSAFLRSSGNSNLPFTASNSIKFAPESSSGAESSHEPEFLSESVPSSSPAPG